MCRVHGESCYVAAVYLASARLCLLLEGTLDQTEWQLTPIEVRAARCALPLVMNDA